MRLQIDTHLAAEVPAPKAKIRWDVQTTKDTDEIGKQIVKRIEQLKELNLDPSNFAFVIHIGGIDG